MTNSSAAAIPDNHTGFFHQGFLDFATGEGSIAAASDCIARINRSRSAEGAG